MYCPVYGCNSDYKNNTDRLGFFAFPSNKNNKEKGRRKVWIDFCKRKKFEPTSNTRICSRHFSYDSYLPSHSPALLASIGYTGKVKYLLKEDAVPTENKPGVLTDSSLQPKKRPCGKLSRVKTVNEALETHLKQDDDTGRGSPG